MSEFLATILSALTALWPGGAETSALIYNGYLEGDFVYLSAAAPGKLTEVRVAEGDVVEAGETLFLIENTHQINALAAAQARVAIAEANLENLQTGGRGAEIDVVRASLMQAEADQTLAATNAQRSAELFSRGWRRRPRWMPIKLCSTAPMPVSPSFALSLRWPNFRHATRSASLPRPRLMRPRPSWPKRRRRWPTAR